jgi:hypothetical protein
VTITIGPVRGAIGDMTAAAANVMGDMADNYVNHPD